jgi:hypothetical protein
MGCKLALGLYTIVAAYGFACTGNSTQSAAGFSSFTWEVEEGWGRACRKERRAYGLWLMVRTGNGGRNIRNAGAPRAARYWFVRPDLLPLSPTALVTLSPAENKNRKVIGLCQCNRSSTV